MNLKKIFSKKSSFPFFHTKKARIYHIINLFIFTTLFLTIYNPFSIIASDKRGFLSVLIMSCVVALVFTIIATITMLINWKRISRDQFKVYHFILMAFANLSLSAIFYVVDDFTLYNYLKTIIFLCGVILVPYLIATLVSVIAFLLKELFAKRKENQEIKQHEEASNTDLIPFVGEYGNVEFYLYKENILYIEANDNYVNIYSNSGEKTTCNILRSSMKSIETQLSPMGIIRCHRSYIVNTKKIVFAKKEKGKIYLELSNCAFLVPVSSSFVPEVEKYFVN